MQSTAVQSLGVAVRVIWSCCDWEGDVPEGGLILDAETDEPEILDNYA